MAARRGDETVEPGDAVQAASPADPFHRVGGADPRRAAGVRAAEMDRPTPDTTKTSAAPPRRSDPMNRVGRLSDEPSPRRGRRVVPDVLLLLVLVQAGRAELAAVAGPLHAAPLGARDVRAEVVDPDRAVAQRGGHPVGP